MVFVSDSMLFMSLRFAAGPLHLLVIQSHDPPQQLVVHVHMHVSDPPDGKDFRGCPADEGRVVIAERLRGDDALFYLDAAGPADVDDLFPGHPLQNARFRAGVHHVPADEKDVGAAPFGYVAVLVRQDDLENAVPRDDLVGRLAEGQVALLYVGVGADSAVELGVHAFFVVGGRRVRGVHEHEVDVASRAVARDYDLHAVVRDAVGVKELLD